MSSAQDFDQWVCGVRARGYVIGRSGKQIPASPAGIDDRQGQILRDHVVKEGAITTIETGMAVGMSTGYICSGLASVGNPECAHTAVDPYQHIFYDDAAVLAMQELGYGPVVELVAADSRFALPDLVRQRRRYDLAFIDGDHRFDGALIDLIYCSRLVRPGGLLIVDDYDMPAVAKAVSYASSNLGIAIEQVCARMAVLRLPAVRQPRPWDHYVDF